MRINEATIRNLELVESQAGPDQPCLYNLLRKTLSPMGHRRLRADILHPLLDIEMIHARLSAISTLLEEPELRTQIKAELKKLPDIERLTSRLALRKIFPRDLLGLSNGIKAVSQLKQLLQDFRSFQKVLPDSELDTTPAQVIDRIICNEPAMTAEDGDIINSGINPELDEARRMQSDAKSVLLNYQEQERQKTGIASIKVKQNRVIGYFIEIPKSQVDKIPDYFIRRQSLSTGERYTTTELGDIEAKIADAQETIMRLQHQIYSELLDELQGAIGLFQNCAQILARIDVIAALTQIAIEYNYICPEVHTNHDLVIKEGRHPVVESDVHS